MRTRNTQRPALIPGRWKYADAHDMYKLLGVRRLPAEGMAEQVIEGVRVYVKPLPPLESIRGTRRHRRFALRVMAICECGQHMAVGRMHQHKCPRMITLDEGLKRDRPLKGGAE